MIRYSKSSTIVKEKCNYNNSRSFVTTRPAHCYDFSRVIENGYGSSDNTNEYVNRESGLTCSRFEMIRPSLLLFVWTERIMNFRKQWLVFIFFVFQSLKFLSSFFVNVELLIIFYFKKLYIYFIKSTKINVATKIRSASVCKNSPSTGIMLDLEEMGHGGGGVSRHLTKGKKKGHHFSKNAYRKT